MSLYYREEALGRGDWKMAAMLGAFLGWQRMLLALLVGSLLGSLVGLALKAWREGRVPEELPDHTPTLFELIDQIR